VAFYLNKTPIPFLGKSKPAAGKDGKESPADAAKGSRGCRKPAAREPTSPSSTSTKSCPAARTRFREGAEEAAKAAKSQPAAAKDVYFIQAGSFQSPADADNQKAKIAILGFESSVEPTTLPDKGTWYRVRLALYGAGRPEPRAAGVVAERNRREPGQSEGPGQQSQLRKEPG